MPFPDAHAMARSTLASRDSVNHMILEDWLRDQGIERGDMIQVGKCYFIETVTKYWTGKVLAVDPDFICLEEAAWVADTGRFAEFLRTGVPLEVEPVPKGQKQYVPVGTITGITEWPHKLPRETK